MNSASPQQLSLTELLTAENIEDSPTSLQATAPSEEVPASVQRELAPMMRQYLDYKKKYPEHLVLCQVGDFYEIFFQDAVRAAEILNIRLTSRDRDNPDAIPMAGVPIHALENYLPKLLLAGCSAVIISQVDDGRERKGMVQREISRIVTPGVRYEGDGLDEARFNYLCAVVVRDEGAGAVVLIDVSTSWVRIAECETLDEVEETVRRARPSEILLPSTIQGVRVDRQGGWLRLLSRCAAELGASTVLRPSERISRPELMTRMGAEPLRGLEERFEGLSLEALRALGLVMTYVDEISFGGAPRVARVAIEEPSRVALIDTATRRNLEILETRIDGQRKHSLLAHLNYTRSAMGARLLSEWLVNPSADRFEIESRHEAVEQLLASPERLADIRQALCSVRDIDRLLSRVTGGRAVPRDLGMLRDSLVDLPKVMTALESLPAPRLRNLLETSDRLADVTERLETTLVEDPPVRLHEGGICRDGFHPEVDRLRSLSNDGARWLLDLEQRERAATGISGLKIKFNNVFGYCIEVSKAHLEKVPAHYERRQTLANAERFILPELKEFEANVLSAKARLTALERELCIELRGWVASQAERIQRTAAMLAELDVLCSFAMAAHEHSYVRPRFVETPSTNVIGGRHPVVERVIGPENFIRNDVRMNGTDRRFAVLTGPNMGGKSTYLRQIGLTQLLAQAGSFVPAERAELSVVDRIFTRIGAADDLARGDSTFMVEMRETATILRRATSRSLVLIDEIGRGTATRDGLAIATAIAEWLHDLTRCQTVFATHFHELTALADRHEGAFCLSVGIVETAGEILFTHRIEERAADRSYGVEVARLAGLPEALVQRASAILANELPAAPALSVEVVVDRPVGQPCPPAIPEDPLSPARRAVFEKIQGLSVNAMTPLQALVALHELRESVERSTDSVKGPR